MKFIVGAVPAWFTPDINDTDLYIKYIKVISNEVDWEKTLEYIYKTCEKGTLCHTHYIQLLNFLDDVVAKTDIYYFNSKGYLKLLFSHPSMLEKLTVMGVGEAISDTYLSQLDHWE